MFTLGVCYGVQRHFQQYFSDIVAVSYILSLVEETGVRGGNHRPTTSY